MYDSLSTYLNSVQRAWSAQDGNLVAAFVSLKDKHVSNRSLQLEMPENMVERMMDPPIDEIVSAHLRVLYYLTCERNNDAIQMELSEKYFFFSIFSQKLHGSLQKSDIVCQGSC